MKVKRILIIVGTRPEAIKLVPVYIEFKKVRNWETVLISTGQHREMLQTIFNFFGLKPDLDLQIMTANQTLNSLTSNLLTRCSELFIKMKPDLIVVQGDTTTSMTAALAAFYLKIPIAHIEAGLRSYDNMSPFPEEVNRRVIGLVSSFHFAPTSLAALAIRREKLPGKIFIVGNTVIDSLLLTIKKIVGRRRHFEEYYAQLIENFKRMVLITGHRRENFGEGFQQICFAIRDLAKRHQDTSFVYPVHLNPNVREPVYRLLNNLPNVFLINPVSYDHMIFLMMRCALVLTDSGGIQEEAPSLGKPVIVMRENTERPEGVKAGCSVLAGTSRNRIVRLVNKLLSNRAAYLKMSKKTNPYGRGDSAKRIVSILKNWF